ALMFANLGVTFRASAIDATDGDLSAGLVWTSDIDGPIGSGAGFFANTLRVGTHHVTATVADAGGLTGVAEGTVVVLPPNTYPAIAIDAPTDGAALFAGMPLLVAAHATDEEDGELSGVIRWSSDRDGPLGTGAMLTMASLSAGAHTITASVTDAAGATSTASVSVVVGPRTITLAPVADTYVDAANPGVKLGSATSLFVDDSPVKQAYLRFDVRGIMPPFTVQRARLRLTAASSSAGAVDRRDGDLSARIQWTSSIDGPLGMGASFARVLSPGTHTIAATVTDSSNVPASATVVVTVISSGNIGFRDFTYPTAVGSGMSNEATAQKPESHLWFVDGTWWATLYSATARAHHIHRLDRATQQWADTGVFIDERPMSRQDCLWHGEKLDMASRTGYLAPGTNRLLRYSYDPTLSTYVLDEGFPGALPGGGPESMTLAEDSTGRF